MTIKELWNIHLAFLVAFIHFRISAEDKNVTFDFIFETHYPEYWTEKPPLASEDTLDWKISTGQ